ncbi:MAG: hypothetical protein GY706_07945, partial [Bacteroides sp.]|nr:hypothetical protein [Bacteroides sp.]
QGTLTVDVTYYEFNNSEIYMGPGAEIYVEQRMKISESSVEGCDEMWRGIRLKPDVNATLIFENSTIRDAQYAISASKNTLVNAIGNNFENNYVGIYAPEGVETFTSTITQNTFQGTDDLLPAYSGQNPAPASLPYAGIELHNIIGIDIGVQGQSTASNSFKSLCNGIVTEGTDIAVFTPEFIGIQGTGEYSLTGHGIHAKGAGQTLIVEGMNENASGPFSFESCPIGIWAQNMHVDIRNNSMTDMRTGVHVELGKNRNILVEDNYVSCSSFGIDLFHNDPALEMKVHSNTVKVLYTSPFQKGNAIQVYEGGLAHTDAAITNNEVRIYATVNGISLNTVQNMRLAGNAVYLQNANKNYSGIALRKTLGITLAVNEVQGVSTGGINNRAYNISSSERAYLDCNTAYKTRTGFRFDDSCADTDF